MYSELITDSTLEIVSYLFIFLVLDLNCFVLLLLFKVALGLLSMASFTPSFLFLILLMDVALLNHHMDQFVCNLAFSAVAGFWIGWCPWVNSITLFTLPLLRFKCLAHWVFLIWFLWRLFCFLKCNLWWFLNIWGNILRYQIVYLIIFTLTLSAPSRFLICSIDHVLIFAFLAEPVLNIFSFFEFDVPFG